MAVRSNICKYFNPELLRLYLRKLGMSSKVFAKRMEVSEQTVSAWRRGRKQPTWLNLIKMADVLEIPPVMLIIKNAQFILDMWNDHLLDYLDASPAEIDNVKLSPNEAIAITERLGYFDERGIESIDGHGETEAQDADLLEIDDAPHISD